MEKWRSGGVEKWRREKGKENRKGGKGVEGKRYRERKHAT
jgi:hypothetical protein